MKAQTARRGGEDLAARVTEIFRRIKERGDDGVWITLRPEEEVLADLARLDPDGPLYGVPFAVKDNVDVEGLPTTAACPAFAYHPARSAPLVERLVAAGALLIGKTNLDQFATGLSGTRSPYGACESPLVAGLISGGSSSGSAVAVAAGLVDFAVGTDTAGSGRVPAAMTGTVGLKPSRGLVPTVGVVPACASLDCPSVFANSVSVAAAALAVMAGPYPGAPWSRELPSPVPVAPARGRRIGVPRSPEFLGDPGAAAGFTEATTRLAELGHEIVPIDLTPFLEAGRLLYEGPWLAERFAAVGDFVAAYPDEVHPVTRQVLGSGWEITGVEVFRGLHRLAELRAETAPVWREIDMLVVPTVPTTFTLAEMAEDPIRRNAALGLYTTFANLLDLAAVAVPAGMTPAGRPHGVTLLAPAGSDGLLAGLGAAFLDEPAEPLGPAKSLGPSHQVTETSAFPDRVAVASLASRTPPEPADVTLLAVVGAHRTGQPLHPQLVALGAVRHGLARTASAYRLHDLGDRPGMIRDPAGAHIEVELHRMTPEALGRLLVRIPPPLGLGTVELEDGRQVHGFLCEPHALTHAPDITAHQSWPAYLDSRL
ncbi:allophanate hydrolase [Streptosporangium sp. NBC_01755]|uniref:allophanate hydrolase n=1 Tax=unclassified Streptosporangium TaxID=2632669 RepID=UPI002DDC3CFC|nr:MULTISPECIES: allophanate hydrolase [unclassified Streptosporangium]WSA28231.1 allophanate hydrolase [Streptosporangium sp. NBC_01810]WSD00292.1 allophanate hydrolase [Streptosporangium sp. NBC_01755]